MTAEGVRDAWAAVATAEAGAEPGCLACRLRVEALVRSSQLAAMWYSEDSSTTTGSEVAA
jgi:hypothetical protein